MYPTQCCAAVAPTGFISYRRAFIRGSAHHPQSIYLSSQCQVTVHSCFAQDSLQFAESHRTLCLNLMIILPAWCFYYYCIVIFILCARGSPGDYRRGLSHRPSGSEKYRITQNSFLRRITPSLPKPLTDTSAMGVK